MLSIKASNHINHNFDRGIDAYGMLSMKQDTFGTYILYSARMPGSLTIKPILH